MAGMNLKIGRRWIYAATGVAVYALAGFLLAPWLAERTLVNTLSERLHLDGRLDDLAVNPFTLTVTADGFSTTRMEDGAPVAAFERLFMNFELVSLFRWAVSFDEMHLIRPVIHFERLSATNTSFSELAATWTGTAAPVQEPPPEETGEASSGRLIRLVIADLRIVEGRLTVADHHREETFETDFAPIDLAVTDLSTLPDDSGTQRVTIRTEAGAEVAWTGSLSVNPLTVTGTVQIHGPHTPLLFRYFRDELALPVDIDGGVLDLSLDYVVGIDDGGTLSALVEHLAGTLSGLSVSQPDHPDLLEVGTVTVRGGAFAWPEQTVHVDEVHLDEIVIDAYRRADGSYLPMPVEVVEAAAVSPASAGETPAAPGTADPPRTAAATAAATIPPGWALTMDALRLTNWRLSHTDTALEDGTLTIEALNLTLADISNAPGEEMSLSLDLAPAAGGRITLAGRLVALPEPTLSGDLEVADLPLAIGQPYLSTLANIGIADGRMGMTGTIASTADDPVRYEGDFRIDDLKLIDRSQEEELLSWASLTVDRLKATTAALELSTLTLADPYARVEIAQDGTSNIARVFQPAAAEPADANGSAPDAARTPAGGTPAPAAGETADPFLVTIGATRVENGRAHFQDLALPLPFAADITDLSGQLSTLNSSSSASARIAIEGQVNEYGRLTIGGSLQPFSPIQGTDVEVAFVNMDLPRMSPYTIKFAGRRIADGRTDLTLTYRVVDGQLEGDNHLVIRGLTLGEKVPYPDAMNLPLDLAVALLKDSSGVVDFNFPVSGSLDDPQFSYSGAVMKALSNVLVGLVTAPFRLLGALVGVAPSELETVAFEPGRADLTPPQREVLARLADALTQRPQLALALTPVFDPDADRLALKEAKLEAEIDARLEAAGAQDALVGEQRRRLLETLYDEADLTPPKSEIRELASPPDAEGKPVFDELDYTERLRSALIEAATVAETELEALAAQRVEAVRQALSEAVGLAPERLDTLAAIERPVKDGEIRMPLEVSARGGTEGEGG